MVTAGIRVFHWPQGHTLITQCGKCPACTKSVVAEDAFVCRRLSSQVQDVTTVDDRCPLPVLKEG